MIRAVAPSAYRRLRAGCWRAPALPPTRSTRGRRPEPVTSSPSPQTDTREEREGERDIRHAVDDLGKSGLWPVRPSKRPAVTRPLLQWPPPTLAPSYPMPLELSLRQRRWGRKRSTGATPARPDHNTRHTQPGHHVSGHRQGVRSQRARSPRVTVNVPCRCAAVPFVVTGVTRRHSHMSQCHCGVTAPWACRLCPVMAWKERSYDVMTL